MKRGYRISYSKDELAEIMNTYRSLSKDEKPLYLKEKKVSRTTLWRLCAKENVVIKYEAK